MNATDVRIAHLEDLAVSSYNLAYRMWELVPKDKICVEDARALRDLYNDLSEYVSEDRLSN